MARRDLKVAALTLCVSGAIFGLGQEQAQVPLRSSVYEWDAMNVQPREFGTRRNTSDRPVSYYVIRLRTP